VLFYFMTFIFVSYLLIHGAIYCLIMRDVAGSKLFPKASNILRTPMPLNLLENTNQLFIPSVRNRPYPVARAVLCGQIICQFVGLSESGIIFDSQFSRYCGHQCQCFRCNPQFLLNVRAQFVPCK
jgi:hypothetical protein